MSNDLIIRPADPSDVPLILSFIRELSEYEKLAHEVVATEAELGKWLFGERPAARVLIAEYRREPAGFALYFLNFSTFLARPGIFLEDLFVRPAVRARGIGKALLKELVRTAAREGYGRVEWAVLDWNTPAVEFYRSLGAQPMSDWTIFRLNSAAIYSLAKDEKN
ncbi:MAG: N-acetyltransferase family protein [Acidobacteriota bacterium]